MRTIKWKKIKVSGNFKVRHPNFMGNAYWEKKNGKRTETVKREKKKKY